MTNRNEILTAKKQIQQLGILPDMFVSDTQDMALIFHTRFENPTTEYENDGSSKILELSMCTANFGKINWRRNNHKLAGVIKPGSVAVTPPQTAGRGYMPKINILSIGVCLDTFNRIMCCNYSAEQFLPAATTLHNDPVLTSVMRALWQEARFHDEISAFFEHGIAVLLKRLLVQGQEKPNPIVKLKLSPKELQDISDLIENRIFNGDNISVQEMANLVKLPPRTFCRAFATTTGYAPYAYFTQRRINIAQRLLRETNMSVTAIASELGYSNASKFSCIFKKNIGLNPRDWRRAVK